MNREDILRMGRQAGALIELAQEKDLLWLERFAALVASAERERLTDAAIKAAEKAVDVAIALEREACAKVCDEYAQNSSNPMNFAENCAKSIRARGQA